MSRKPFDPRRITLGRRPEEAAAQSSLFDPIAPDVSSKGEKEDEQAQAWTAPVTVSQLVRRIKTALTDQLPATIHVIGELSDVSQPSSGHIYMTLKDSNCELRAVMWRSAVKSLKFEPTDGLEVLASGTVDVYEPRGQVQFYVRRLLPRGRGALELAFQQLHDKLKKEGLFDRERKRPLPEYPRRIGVVTSSTGAAIRDITETLRRRYKPVEVILAPVRVQGAGAAEEIARAIDRFNAWSDKLGGIDLLIVGRGGGSMEDLWSFNEEVVARALARSRLVVISAVGHEVDVTISDLVADVRAPTPTAAAELAVPDANEVLDLLGNRQTRLTRSLEHVLEMSRAHLSRLEQDELFRKPENLINRGHQQLDEAAAKLRWAPLGLLRGCRTALDRGETRLGRLQPSRLLGASRERIARLERALSHAEAERLREHERRLGELGTALVERGPARLAGQAGEALRQLTVRLHRAERQWRAEQSRRVEELATRLEASSHHRVLARGYSLTRDKNSGKIIRAPGEVKPGSVIRTQLRDGTIDSLVERTEETQAGES
jgi:exodeoxyribonuclease VII large subunit